MCKNGQYTHTLMIVNQLYKCNYLCIHIFVESTVIFLHKDIFLKIILYY